MSESVSAVRRWSLPVPVDDIPETGRHVDLNPDEATRAAVAGLASVLALPRLEASFDLARHGADGVHVVGRVSATVDQACVVTLDAMQSEVDEAVDLVFTPRAGSAEARGSLPVDADEPPEMLHDGVVDLGAVATEFLLLAIDPYPRKPDAVFAAAPAKPDPADSPFAALAALKPDATQKKR